MYNKKKYFAAISFFTEALKLCPDIGELYSNRSICYLKLNKAQEAMQDGRKSVQLNPHKCLNNFIHTAVESKKVPNAIEFLDGLSKTNSIFLKEMKTLIKIQRYDLQAKKAYNEHNYWNVLYCTNKCLEELPSSVRFNVKKAEILVYVNQFDDAEKIINNLKYLDWNCDNEIFLRGLIALYKLGDFEKANEYFRLVLPWSAVYKRKQAIFKTSKELFSLRKLAKRACRNMKFEESLNMYSEALKIDPFNKKINSKLYCGRGIVQTFLNRRSESIQDFSRAIELDATFLKPVLKRASIYFELENTEAAIADYEKAYSMDDKIENRKLLKENQNLYIKVLSGCAELLKNRAEFEEAVGYYERIYKIESTIENRELLEEAIYLANAGNQTHITEANVESNELKSFYIILGVGRNATQKEIKSAYHKKALLHHPDRHLNAAEDEKKREEERFKEIYKVYKVLSDPIRRRMYDRT